MGLHDGHRKRAIEKLKENNLVEHELLEVLLFNAIPRRNTNDLAHRLLAEFGSIQNLFNASMERLQQVKGVGESIAAYVFVIGQFYKKAYKPVEVEYPERFDEKEFYSFIKRKYANERKETLSFYFLDHDSKIIGHEQEISDSSFKAELPPEELTNLLAKYAPAGLVVVHNHPIGEARPSGTDDKMTRQIQLICSMHNVILCDHIIYASEGIYSYYFDGKLKEISQKYSFSEIMAERNV